MALHERGQVGGGRTRYLTRAATGIRVTGAEEPAADLDEDVLLVGVDRDLLSGTGLTERHEAAARARRDAEDLGHVAGAVDVRADCCGAGAVPAAPQVRQLELADLRGHGEHLLRRLDAAVLRGLEGRQLLGAVRSAAAALAPRAGLVE